MESEELQALETASGSGLLERFFDREVDAGGDTNALKVQVTV